MPKPPNAAEMIFSAKSFAAAMLALYIALGMGLPRPFWAMMTAYVVAGPLSGAVRSKAVYRVAGTILGSVAAVALTVALVDAPELMVLGVGLWVGLCLFVSLLDRTPRSYLFMLAGYTAGLIAFPAVTSPDTIFDTGLARVEEILLGILCATVIHSVVLPRGIGPVLLARLDATLRDAERWTLDALSGADDAARAADRQTLARDVTELRVMSAHLPYDTSDVRWMTRSVRALTDRMTYLLPVLAAVGERLAALREAGDRDGSGGLPPALLPVLEDVKRWIADDSGTPAQADALRAALDRLAPVLGDDRDDPSAWHRATLLGLVTRLRTLVGIHRDCRELRAHIRSGNHSLPAHLDPLTRGRSRGVFHLDCGMALWSGAAAFLGIVLVSGFWIATGWSSGSAAAMMVAIFCCFFASFDDPAPGIRMFLVFTLLSMPIGAFYLLVVLPSTDSFPMLALSLAPTFLLLGCFIPRPALMGQSMALLFGVAGSLSLLDTNTADFASFLNSSSGQVVGIVAALQVTRLCRSVGAAWSARRLLHAGWREIAALAAVRSPSAATGFESRMLDRVGLLSARFAQIGPQPGRRLDPAAIDAVADLRVGLNVVELQRVRPALGRAAAPAIERLLGGIAGHFRARITKDTAKHPSPPPEELLGSLDGALSSVGAAPPSPERDRAVVALAGLRRSLFPTIALQAPAHPEGVTA
ncbi:FUSC family protein [Azospirillum agricola]|uniref:FUSC family protein n=1 Tax=Azospirillum agricola TaxID=1720247 RepID=UPI000A0F38A9|nr:FUSC family protein [Azospirillum agricola]SMH35846.1 Uncharacterized membrane protein YccC [Azospirillum lipoferum]